MLKNLFISKVRVKLLQQFFFNPKEQFHVRGLVRILDEEINAIRRELLNLEDAGILKFEKQGNKIVYTVNKSNPLVEDLRNLIAKGSDLGKKILKVSKDVGKVSTVLATNPFFTGEYKDENDLDLLFIGEVDLRKLSLEMKDVENFVGRELRYTAVTVQDFDFGKKKRSPVILNVINDDFVIIVGSLRQLIS